MIFNWPAVAHLFGQYEFNMLARHAPVQRAYIRPSKKICSCQAVQRLHPPCLWRLWSRIHNVVKEHLKHLLFHLARNREALVEVRALCELQLTLRNARASAISTMGMHLNKSHNLQDDFGCLCPSALCLFEAPIGCSTGNSLPYETTSTSLL